MLSASFQIACVFVMLACGVHAADEKTAVQGIPPDGLRLPVQPAVGLIPLQYEIGSDHAGALVEPTGHPEEMSPAQVRRHIARIVVNSPEELENALLRAEALYERGDVTTDDNPFAFVLHGPEVSIFLKDNYAQYKPIVDLAARLSAFNVVDVTVCETRMGVLGAEKASLAPFVKTVPFGPLEVDRLVDSEGYVYF